MDLIPASKTALRACLPVSSMSREQAGYCTGATGSLISDQSSLVNAVFPKLTLL